MCGNCHVKRSPEYREAAGPVFNLSGDLLEGDAAKSLKSASPMRVLLEMRHGKASVYVVPRERARQEAFEIAERTGNPVNIADVLDASSTKTGATLRRVAMVWTAKSDPLSVEAFDDWTAELAMELEALAMAEAVGMVESLADLIDFNYATAGTARLEALREGIGSRLAIPPAQIARGQQIIMSQRLAEVVRAVGGGMARTPAIQGTVGAGLSLPGRELGSLMSRFQSFFVRDQYGRVSQSLGREAVTVINRGLADGLGRVELAERLRESMSDGLRMKGYWETVASNAIGHARSYTQGASMRSAGIEAFRIIAVMDDVTTPLCMYLNDKIVPVGGAMALMDRQLSAATPEAFMDAHPLARQQGDRVFHRYSDGTERDILRVVGPGQYAPSFPASQLVDASIGTPPYHFRCRSTFVAV